MRVLIQWATSTPGGWTTHDLNAPRDVRNLPKKAVPSNTSVLDDNPGWIAGVNLQGVVFTGYDHLGFDVVLGSLVVKAWNDDLDDFPVGTRWGQEWTFATPAPDPALGGRVNTVQTVKWYGESNSLPVLNGVQGVLPWTSFSLPANNLTIHGVWMSDAQWTAHKSLQSVRGWQEWVV